jgi:hypothetical protein
MQKNVHRWFIPVFYFFFLTPPLLTSNNRILASKDGGRKTHSGICKEKEGVFWVRTCAGAISYTLGHYAIDSWPKEKKKGGGIQGKRRKHYLHIWR